MGRPLSIEKFDQVNKIKRFCTQKNFNSSISKKLNLLIARINLENFFLSLSFRKINIFYIIRNNSINNYRELCRRVTAFLTPVKFIRYESISNLWCKLYAVEKFKKREFWSQTSPRLIPISFDLHPDFQ